MLIAAQHMDMLWCSRPAVFPEEVEGARWRIDHDERSCAWIVLGAFPMPDIESCRSAEDQLGHPPIFTRCFYLEADSPFCLT
jgi:hypothetical protein